MYSRIQPRNVDEKRKRKWKISVSLLIVLFILILPPTIHIIGGMLGIASFFFLVTLGLFGIAVLVWAALSNTLALSEDQVPPELRKQEDVVTVENDEQEGSAALGGEE